MLKIQVFNRIFNKIMSKTFTKKFGIHLVRENKGKIFTLHLIWCDYGKYFEVTSPQAYCRFEFATEKNYYEIFS